VKQLGFLLLLIATPVSAQQARIGIIDTYGLRTLTAERVLQVAGIEVGDSVTATTRTEAVARLMALPVVRDAHIAIVCCENGQSIAYIGVLEGDNQVLPYGPAPTGTARLPVNIIQAEMELSAAMQEAVQRNETEDSDSLGHSLFRYSPARAIQERFVQYAAGNVATLREVLRTSGDAGQRALAAQVIAYVPQKHTVVPDLVAALRDPDATVRNNAMRALAIMASWAQRNPDAMLRIPFDPFVAMLNSPVWTDRNKGAFVLMSLSVSRDPALFRLLRAQAFPALVDMVRWRSPGHALPAALILGRMAGMPDDEIMPAFEKDREVLIEQARLAL
jgi:hypothetical protein